jgi:hypothetical protein
METPPPPARIIDDLDEMEYRPRSERARKLKRTWEIRRGHRYIGITDDKQTAEQFEEGGYDVTPFVGLS